MTSSSFSSDKQPQTQAHAPRVGSSLLDDLLAPSRVWPWLQAERPVALLLQFVLLMVAAREAASRIPGLEPPPPSRPWQADHAGTDAQLTPNASEPAADGQDAPRAPSSVLLPKSTPVDVFHETPQSADPTGWQTAAGAIRRRERSIQMRFIQAHRLRWQPVQAAPLPFVTARRGRGGVLRDERTRTRRPADRAARPRRARVATRSIVPNALGGRTDGARRARRPRVSRLRRRARRSWRRPSSRSSPRPHPPQENT